MPKQVTFVQAKALKAKDAGTTKTKKSAEGHTTKGKAFYKGLTADSDYQGEDYDVFSSWLGQTAWEFCETPLVKVY